MRSLSVRLTKPLDMRLAEFAEARSLSAGAALREIVADYFNRIEDDSKLDSINAKLEALSSKFDELTIQE